MVGSRVINVTVIDIDSSAAFGQRTIPMDGAYLSMQSYQNALAFKLPCHTFFLLELVKKLRFLIIML